MNVGPRNPNNELNIHPINNNKITSSTNSNPLFRSIKTTYLSPISNLSFPTNRFLWKKTYNIKNIKLSSHILHYQNNNLTTTPQYKSDFLDNYLVKIFKLHQISPGTYYFLQEEEFISASLL